MKNDGPQDWTVHCFIEQHSYFFFQSSSYGFDCEGKEMIHAVSGCKMAELWPNPKLAFERGEVVGRARQENNRI